MSLTCSQPHGHTQGPALPLGSFCCFLLLKALLLLCLTTFYSSIKGSLKTLPPGSLPWGLWSLNSPGSPPCALRQLMLPALLVPIPTSSDVFHTQWWELPDWLRGPKGPVLWVGCFRGCCPVARGWASHGWGSLPVLPAWGMRLCSGRSRGMGPRIGPQQGCVEPAHTSAHLAGPAPARLWGETSEV